MLNAAIFSLKKLEESVPRISFNLNSIIIGAGNGIRTHADQKVQGLSRPAR